MSDNIVAHLQIAVFKTIIYHTNLFSLIFCADESGCTV